MAISAQPVERRISLSAFYNAVYSSRGFALAPHHYPIVAGLEDSRIDNLLLLGPPGLGKSNMLSSVYPAWELGHDPTLTILSVSAGEKLPQGFMAATMQIIQHDKTFRELFPGVRPAPNLGWSIQRGLFVTGHHPSDPDASYVSVGVASKTLTGLHARLHIYDDLHDRENAATPEGRAQVKTTYYDTLLGRADPRGARRVAAGRWWAPDDVYQEWIANGEWVVLQLPARREGQTRLWYDVFVPKGIECVYTDTLEPEPNQDPSSPYVRYRAYYAAIDTQRKGFYWPGSPSKRREYETTRRRNPRVASINYDGDMAGGGEGIFREDDFKVYMPPCDLSTGRGTPGFEPWATALKGEVEQAWDTALGQPQSSSNTVALTGLLVPCQSWHCGEDPEVVGPCDFHYDVLLLWALVKDIDFRELAMALRTQFGLWHPRRVNVEEKQSGVSLLQTFKGSQIPVHGQKVEQGKVERAVNPVLTDGVGSGLPVGGGAASVQGWARMGRVSYPSGAPWVEAGPDGTAATGFIKRVVSFTGGMRGVSDEFDALVHLVTRAIIKSRRHGMVGLSGPQDPHAVPPDALLDDPRRQALEGIGQAPTIADMMGSAFQGFCGAPCQAYGIVENREWCSVHGRGTTAFDGCSSWKPRSAA